MRLVVLRCGTDIAVPPSTQLIDVKAVPTRQELKALDSLAAEVLPEDPTPSLAEIAAQPDVAHLGADSAHAGRHNVGGGGICPHHW